MRDQLIIAAFSQTSKVHGMLISSRDTQISDWVPSWLFHTAMELQGGHDWEFHKGTVEQRRVFLLLCAEAVS
jgi:hypothetical protein